jgi:hypothetical protein
VRPTLKSIHDELKRLGYDVHLEKGDGYFYFWGGEATEWLDRTITVRTLGSLTLEQWTEEFQRLRKLNAQLAGGESKPKTRGRRPKKK